MKGNREGRGRWREKVGLGGEREKQEREITDLSLEPGSVMVLG